MAYRIRAYYKNALGASALMLQVAVSCLVLLAAANVSALPEKRPGKTRVFVIGAVDKYHSPMAQCARAMFDKIATENGLDVHFTTDTAEISIATLTNYDVFVQLHVAPYDLSASQQFAIQQFISRGKGWIGIHAAGLIGTNLQPADRHSWRWYWQLLGGANYTPHPPLQDGTVRITDRAHPVVANLPESFTLRDEWYEFDAPPADAHVLAIADESSYQPKTAMGNHPVIWTNPNYERALYISVGHDVSSCGNTDYHVLIRDAIKWAADNEGHEQRVMDAFANSPASVLVNQVGYDAAHSKRAMLRTREMIAAATSFTVVDALSLEKVFEGTVGPGSQVKDWGNHWFASVDFTSFTKPGYYKIVVNTGNTAVESFAFEIGNQMLTKQLVPAITSFFEGQKALSKEELSGDTNVRLYGSDKTVDLRGGWADASGDVSKYFSHLAYTNFMNPQQTPLVDWSMIDAAEAIPNLLEGTAKDSLIAKAFYGAGYIMKSLSPEGYFYMTLFSYFKKDPSERRVVGLLADSKTTSDYQCGYREGGGMGVAALARISTWKHTSKYKPEEYLQAAERAFAHLQKYSIQYIDDHKENIIDDYTALMAATELSLATRKPAYRQEAQRRARRLENRISDEGFFWSNDEKTRPFWHASDAGLPVIALIRYLDLEKNAAERERAIAVIRKFIDYQLKVSAEVSNPFQYPRQTFRIGKVVKNGFFIPHDNESGWWWQGEDARIGSLTTVLLRGGRLVYPDKNGTGVKGEIAEMSLSLINWVLGCNPYQVCMMYGYGQVNVPYMAAMYGHGSGVGGISNGITGSKEHNDGSGIDFRYEDNGNEWRWSEQWIPHTAWFLQALTALERK
ncbi:ThuA domain-containing protein [Chryseolinea sp. T2]|uniref:ThuA domain-containing protein n=1 Tax=Chryseolinea sp. T2 TaxID=3129255 RepID=UPI0030785AE7